MRKVLLFGDDVVMDALAATLGRLHQASCYQRSVLQISSKLGKKYFVQYNEAIATTHYKRYQKE
jgi:hypothetical protein